MINYEPSTGPTMQHERANAAAANVDPMILAHALDHIARSAANSRSQTRRLRWIVRRAEVALRGDEYRDIDHDLPKRPPGLTHEKVVRRMSFHIAIKHQLLAALLDLHEAAAASTDKRPEFLAALERAGIALHDASMSLEHETLPTVSHAHEGGAS